MSIEQRQLQSAIAALEAQRATLGDAVVEALLAPARARLAALSGDQDTAGGPAQSLRQVSILFLDVVGSTALAQHLDPEAISTVLDGLLARGTAIVQAHQGRVLQYAGDNILAAFGADEVREDDAERAVRCGLALLDMGKSVGADVRAMHGHLGVDVRVGIHTGGVLLGGGVDAEGSIRGVAVAIAARMEQTAPAGALRISHDTYALVRGAFEVQAQEPMAVKGVDAPLQSWLVLGAKPRNFRIGTRGIEGVATRMIGREAELELLQAAFAHLYAERRFTAVTVVADAGLGKSRLQYEFSAWSEARPERFYLFRGRATPQTATQAFGLLRDILAWRFHIADDDGVEVARAKMEQGIVPLFEVDEAPEAAEGHAHLLGHLIGIEWQQSRHVQSLLDDPKQLRNRAFHVAAQLFRRVSASDGLPVVMQLEDLHWADVESLDLLDYLAEINRDVPMLVLATTRPTLYERRSDWTRADGARQRVDLPPLDKRASRDLANELLKKLPDVPAALRELLTSSAEGSPFYMEELVKMLIDQGAITVGERWKVDPARLLLTRVPATLTGVLQSRLDGLPPAEKRALQQASVVGAVFWDQALAALDAQAVDQLPALVRREITLPRVDAALQGLREYAFRHQVLHQVTYDTVLRRDKRQGHAKVAQWLAGLSAQGSLREGDFMGLAAQHFELAGDEASAAEYHARAAEQALQRLAHDRVLAHVERALALQQQTPAPLPALRWRLLTAREKTLHTLARREQQAVDLEALAQLADAMEDDRLRAEAALRRNGLSMRTSDWDDAQRSARHAMACASRAGDEDLRLRSLRALAWALVEQGAIDSGRALALDGLAQARSLGMRRVEASLLNVLSIAADMQGDLLGSLALDRQSLLANQEAGNRSGEAIARLNLGEGWMKLGDLVQARRELDAALQMLRAIGDRTVEGVTLCNLSMLALWQGDETGALTLARSALAIAVGTQARDSQVLAELRQGDAELALGRLPEALEAYTRAGTVSAQLGSAYQHDAAACLAGLALALGDAAGALAALSPLLKHVAQGGNLDGTKETRRIELTCHKALAQAGDPRADDWLSRANAALMAQAHALTDPGLRQGFLQNIPHHRRILSAWAARP